MLVLFFLVVGLFTLSRFAGTPGGQSVPIGEARVFNRERADGVHPSLQALLNAWEAQGTFHVTVAGGSFPNGGLRGELDVAKAQALGVSRAEDLSQTAHGRGAAIDVWPLNFDPFKSFQEQPDMFPLFMEWAAFVERHGFKSGRHFTNIVAPDGVVGDWPHAEMYDWRSLPYPPPQYG